MLRNPAYCGKIFIPTYKDEEVTSVQGIHDPIISEELFEEAQEVLNGRKRNVPTKNTKKEELPLRGFLVCSKYGKNLTGSAVKGNGGKYFYYHCYPGCSERFRADAANLKFTDLLQQVAFNKQALDLYQDTVEKIFKENGQDKSQRKKV